MICGRRSGGERRPALRRPETTMKPASATAPIRLLVNADDFGLSESVNAAVVEAYDHGILTSCSLMVAEPAAPAAVRAARERPGLAVGLHLVVAAGCAVLPPAVVPRLIDASGRFPTT